MSEPKRKKPCGNPNCSATSNIAEDLSFGSGEMDNNGFWERPCAICARAYEKENPGAQCCPYKDDAPPTKRHEV